MLVWKDSEQMLAPVDAALHLGGLTFHFTSNIVFNVHHLSVHQKQLNLSLCTQLIKFSRKAVFPRSRDFSAPSITARLWRCLTQVSYTTQRATDFEQHPINFRANGFLSTNKGMSCLAILICWVRNQTNTHQKKKKANCSALKFAIAHWEAWKLADWKCQGWSVGPYWSMPQHRRYTLKAVCKKKKKLYATAQVYSHRDSRKWKRCFVTS